MLVTYCFSVYCNEHIIIPMQLFMSLSSVYPERQEQLYPPIELVHMCSQPSVLRTHSSISAEKKASKRNADHYTLH